MNLLQAWGAVRGVIIAIGGALIAVGVLKITTDQLNQLLTQGTAVVTAIGGLVAVVMPMYQGWKQRSRKGAISAAADVLKPGENIIVDSATANAIPSEKVVSGSTFRG